MRMTRATIGRGDAPKGGKRVLSEKEHRMQVSLFTWAKLAQAGTPELAMLFAVPNGGARHVAVAAKLKAGGAKAGVPDVCLPVSRGGYHGLWLELKVGKNDVTDKQAWWIAHLLKHGHLVQVVHDDWDKAREIIERYLAGNYTKDKRPNAPGTIEDAH